MDQGIRILRQRVDQMSLELDRMKQDLARAEQTEYVTVKFPGSVERYVYRIDPRNRPTRIEPGDYFTVLSPRSGRREIVRVYAAGNATGYFGATKVATFFQSWREIQSDFCDF